LAQKQACAATGQSLLTGYYERALGQYNIKTAQALLTLHDTENRRRWLNARSTLKTLLSFGVIPIINENDTVSTTEIRYGDNDRLAARAAQMMSADTLILLSDIDGLYTDDPRVNQTAAHIPIIDEISEDIMQMGGDANSSAGLGSGGMATKLLAAQIATGAGCHMAVMDGRAPAPLSRLRSGDMASWFRAATTPKNARQQWIAGTLKPSGDIWIDDGARTALSQGKSLLAAGVTAISGPFEKGDCVKILCANGTSCGLGLIAYDAVETQKIIGKRSEDAAKALSYDKISPLIHRDNLIWHRS
jgi:glutamate 5-kinase